MADDTPSGSTFTAVNPKDPRQIDNDKQRKLTSTYPPNSATFSYFYSRPQSAHSGGVNVAMCGGECFFLRDDIDYRVYEQLMTQDGKHSAMQPNKITYTLDENDYK